MTSLEFNCNVFLFNNPCNLYIKRHIDPALFCSESKGVLQSRCHIDVRNDMLSLFTIHK